MLFIKRTQLFLTMLAILLQLFTLPCYALVLEDLIKDGLLEQTLSNRKIGYDLGSFDPLHLGHEDIVTGALTQNLCDFVLVYPAWGGDLHKDRVTVEARLDMIFSAFEQHPHVIVTRMPPQELQAYLTRPTTNIHVTNGNTFVESAFEGTTFIGIIGSDVALDMTDPAQAHRNFLKGSTIPKTFYNHTKGCSRALPVQSFIVSQRKGDTLTGDILALNENILSGRPLVGFIENEEERGLSSTKIRNLVKDNSPIDSMVSASVAKIIYEKGLYR